MGETKLTQEEIEALLRQEEGDISEHLLPEDETGEAEERPVLPKGMAETCKVVFNRIEDAHVVRQEANIEELNHVTFHLQMVLGETVLTVEELVNLEKDSVIVLDRLAGENARLVANGRILAEGEIVVLNDCFSLRISSMEEGKRVPGSRQEKEETSSP